jgi:ELWxxDGT repeat protein
MLLSASVVAASDFTKLDQNYVFIGDGLWRTDLTAAGTQQISTVAVSRTWSIEPFAELDGKLIFAGDDGVHGLELWITDGTSAGTQLLKDINLGGSSKPALVAAADGMVLFTADDGVHGAALGQRWNGCRHAVAQGHQRSRRFLGRRVHLHQHRAR